jgi:hypothetical protein
MTLAEAAQELGRRVGAKEGDTPLSDSELVAILANHTRYTTYAAATAYVIGNRVRLSGAVDNGRIYRCVVPGTSAASGLGPTWPKSYSAFVGQNFYDGTDLIWEDDGPDNLGAYDLSGAERDAWLLKASKVEGAVDSNDSSGLSLKSSQEAEHYRKRANLKSPVWVA